MDHGLLTTAGPDYEGRQPNAASTWQAPVAHGGDQTELKRWWSQFNDPVLTLLIDSAQKESSSLAQAAARIEQSRATAIAAGASGTPSLDAIASLNRSSFTFGGPAQLRTQAQVGLQSSWEIDLFGGFARQRQAAAATLASSAAAWHDAR